MVGFVYVTQRIPETDVALTPPSRPGGGLFPYLLVHDSGRHATFADTFEELADVLIDTHTVSGDPETQRDRYADFAGFQQAPIQAAIVASHDGPIEDRHLTVLDQPRNEPVTIREWDGPVPLVICDRDYLPYTTVPRPRPVTGSKVIVLDSTSAETLIRSLNQTGVVVLHEVTG